MYITQQQKNKTPTKQKVKKKKKKKKSKAWKAEITPVEYTTQTQQK